MFARYALSEVIFIAALGAVASVLVGFYAAWWAMAPASLTAALLSFYRDPPRRVPGGDDILVSPADGWVVDVQRAKPAPDGKSELAISIFLSVADVHLNRAPCAGTVREVQYRRGEFLNAMKKESIERNEQNMLIIDPAAPIPGPVRVRQIAGGLARRIVCAVRPGEKLASGQRYGMIKLGSRTEVFAPADEAWEVLVRVGQHVRGGATVLARLKKG